ncbi:FAD-dependent oxidoreductase [Kineobactrum salinum]|uniref:NAD(P)-binding protein n=1 Tax=Kineobactrum salinum TaxID=2708301 RepID=A0A6C0U4I4_9GAMM|nr:FAD-dependent oxidoreductase [Kineobactrum salinum]QIB66916.1 NAD(P)-binding protein [Kineobactrum salinum]
MNKVPVVIVGAGPVGLSCAIELGTRGIECLLVERHDRVGVAPRAKTTNVRSRTHFRRWGIADKLAAASPFGVDYPSNIHFVTRLSGYRLAMMENAFNCNPQRDERYPEHAQWIPQYKVEQILREYADSLPGVTLHFSTELLDAHQTDNVVTATLRDLSSDTEYTVQCQNLIGADGARSRVREIIGATMKGTYGLSRNYNIVFRAPGLAEAHSHGPGVMYWHINPEAPALIGPMDEGDKWFFMPTKLEHGRTLSDAEATELIRRSTGFDLPFEPLSNDEWVASRFIADKYHEGRVFLAGDACHLHPPFGGYGMNMGICDAVDLGWKIAANLQGWGGPALLQHYGTERRPVHEYILDEAVSNHEVLANQLWQQGLEDATLEGEALRRQLGERIRSAKGKEFYSLGAVLGYRYEDSPLIVGDGSEAPAQGATNYVATSRPGHLAPHTWLDTTTSLYDQCGLGFALITKASTDPRAISDAVEEADARGIPLAVVTLDTPEQEALYPSGLTLVRPDQHVAWRGENWDENTFNVVCGH